MKTVKQIADELGVDKQKVYRYIKNNQIKEVHHEALHEALQKNGAKYYDEVAESLIKQGFTENSASNEVHHEAHQKCFNEALFEALLNQISTLESELKIKNNQINSLNERLEEAHKIIDHSQQLQAIAENKIALLESQNEEVKEPEEKKSFWKRLFG